MWRQRFRVQWINEGDNNTEFFHRTANGRKRCNTINSVFINGVELVDQRDLNNAFTNYFKGILGSKPARRNRANCADLHPPDSRIDLSDLDILFSESEIWKVIFDMPSDKAPRPDGFPILFYKEFWPILKYDLICMYNEFYNGQTATRLLQFCIHLSPP